MQKGEIKAFYDEFMDSRMLDYRVKGSKRLDLAIDLIEPLIATESVVLDLGCGIGIVAERLSRIASKGFVLGVDISERNIWYANQSVRRPNARFIEADVVTDLHDVRALLGRPVDAVVMIDTIEHIPENDRLDVLQSLGALCSPSAVLVATFPSPQYQRYLQDNNPGELQIVDNIVEPETLFAEAKEAGFYPVHYALVASGHTNQYVHCVFRRSVRIDPVPWTVGAMVKRVPRKIGRLVTRPLRVHRYKRRVFTDAIESDSPSG